MRTVAAIFCLAVLLCSCSTITPPPKKTAQAPNPLPSSATFAERMPKSINPSGENAIVVDPNVHAWGAYNAEGELLRGGLATSGADWCPDIHRRCHTRSGTFRIQSLGAASCKSSIYPLGRGGAPMPYCMFFDGSQGLHGSYELRDGNASHGCVRLPVDDAEWIRFQFAHIGTKVIVKSY